MHEDLRRDQAVRASSDRAFGLVFVVVFLIVAAWPLLDGEGLRWWSAAIAAAIAALAVFMPKTLAPLNRLWTKFGLLLHRITNPLLLGVIFFLAVVPTGLIMRALGKDPLRLRRDPAVSSYWIRREPPGPPPRTLDRQF
ncbi:MAG: hypothetical protein FJX46_01755 [Alphaproteobacteria bacterium]|nr:hypothetical protein [Alphaproteobacteria bacterium]